MINLHRLITRLFPDRRPDWEQRRERDFIQAANSLKTLKVTAEGGLSIDPEELREQIVASREQLKHLVHKPVTTTRPSSLMPGQEASPITGVPSAAFDCIEVVAWRRLPSGTAVRYTCFQRVDTGRFVVATASLFSGDAESLPRWIDGDTHRQVASVLQNGQLDWHATVNEAMNAWDAEL